MTLEEYLKVERRPLRWVGDACGVSRQAVFNWIVGEALPSKENAEIVEALTDGAVPAKQWRER